MVNEVGILFNSAPSTVLFKLIRICVHNEQISLASSSPKKLLTLFFGGFMVVDYLSNIQSLLFQDPCPTVKLHDA
jgi:hypothetical protein